MRSLLLALVCACAASAQFRIVLITGGNTIPVQNGGNLPFNAPVGTEVKARLSLIYAGTGRASLSQVPTLLGPDVFTATIVGTLPQVVNPGSSFDVDLTYKPVSTAATSGLLSLNFFERTPQGQELGAPVLLTLTGAAPAFGLSYILAADQNVVPLPAGATLGFPATPLGTVGQAALNVTNIGSGPGQITGISLTPGSLAFRLTRLPLFPVPVPAGQALQVGVSYTPTGFGTDAGQIRITYDTGETVNVGLEGRGVSASFFYRLIPGPDTGVGPGGEIALPNASVGQSSSVFMEVRNTGNAAGTVNAVTAAGTGFTLSGLAILPVTLQPNTSLTFGIQFTPTRAGRSTGSLIINGDRFDLSGTGLGSQLTLSYEAAGGTVTLDAANPAVVFPPVRITDGSTLLLRVKNTGTLTATLSNIGTAPADGVFILEGLPGLPLRLEPDQELAFNIRFRPQVVGFTNGTLRLDNTVVNLVGSGTAPPPLPAYTITAPTGDVAPGAITTGLTLSAPYPSTIIGTLVLGSTGGLPFDPAAQFSSGGQTVAFRIPANSTRAVFGGQATELGLQTGTVANTLTLTPSFNLQPGGVEITPNTPTRAEFSVARARPTLIAAQVNSAITGGQATLSVTVVGFTTTRSLTQMVVEFTPATGVSMANTRFTIDLRPSSTIWFGSVASQSFGGQFTVAVPFSFQSSTATTAITQIVSAVSVSVSNEIGTSAALTPPVQ